MKRWVVGLLFLCGCQSVTDGAKQQFSEEHTCPLDRIETRARPELKPSQFREPSTPPADIASDPGRLQVWRAEQARFASNDDDWGHVVEARGCDAHVFYTCGHPTSSSDGRRWMCSTESHVPDAISKW